MLYTSCHLDQPKQRRSRFDAEEFASLLSILSLSRLSSGSSLLLLDICHAVFLACNYVPSWEPANLDLSFHGGWLAPNIYYLGSAGCVEVGGLRIGGISGIYKNYDYPLGQLRASSNCLIRLCNFPNLSPAFVFELPFLLC